MIFSSSDFYLKNIFR